MRERAEYLCMFVYIKETQKGRDRDRKCWYVCVTGDLGLLSSREG